MRIMGPCLHGLRLRSRVAFDVWTTEGIASRCPNERVRFIVNFVHLRFRVTVWGKRSRTCDEARTSGEEHREILAVQILRNASFRGRLENEMLLFYFQRLYA